jgi:hypothetical protein
MLMTKVGSLETIDKLTGLGKNAGKVKKVQDACTSMCNGLICVNKAAQAVL